MRKTRAAIAALVFVTFGVALWVLLNAGKREPVYQGKTLTYWLSDFGSGSSRKIPDYEKLEQDELAVRQIGTNAIPILLQWISTKDGPVKAKIVAWIWRHPRVPFHLESSVDKNMLADTGFRILGKSQASSAVPALVQIVKDGGGERTSAYTNVTFAMWALAHIDPEAATQAGIQFGTNGIVIGWKAQPVAASK